MEQSAQIVPIRNTRDPCGECALLDECLARDVDNPEAQCRSDIDTAPRILRRGDHIFRGGEPFKHLYMVRSGAVKTYAVSPSGDEQVISFHLPGDLIGVDAIATGSHVSNAAALDTSSICVLPYDQLCRLCGHSPTVQRRLMKKMSRRIRYDESRLIMLGQKSADQRIASFLLALSRRQIELGYTANELNLPMSRVDIASYLALAVETVSRVLTRLQDAGVLAVQRNHVEILDDAALTAVADEASVARNYASHHGAQLN